MKITRVDAFPIRIPTDAAQQQPDLVAGLDKQPARRARYRIAPNSWTSIYSSDHETCLVRLETDDGLVGWGEAQAPVGGRATQALVEELCAPLLLGHDLADNVIGGDPFDVEYIWYRLYSAMRERGHITGFYVDALAGVDLALYDLLGKALDKPAYKLLGGGFRGEVLVYVGMGGTEAKQVAQTAREHVDLGYRAIKLHLRQPNPALLEVVAGVREAVGPAVTLMVDVHGTRDVSGAIELGRGLERLGVRWLEAPCQPEDIRGQAEIARALDMQVATGEWLRTVWEWRGWIERRAFDVAMPDIARTGLSEGKRIAALCDAFNLPIAPHVGGGGILSVAASIHYALAIPNFQILEHSHRAHEVKGRIATAYPEPVAGVFELPTAPGLGVEIDEEAVRAHAVG